MSGVSLPVSRASGRALVIGSTECRALGVGVLGDLGYQVAEFDEPYSAMAELSRRAANYRALIISLSTLYREELQMIAAVVARFPQVEVWLTHTDGRPAALAEAMRMGAHGLLSAEGLHRFAGVTQEPRSESQSSPAEIPEPQTTAPPMTLSTTEQPREINASAGEPVLTAEELRALLEEAPAEANHE